MTQEQQPIGNTPDFGIIIPTLIAPIDGDFEDVYAQYLNNPEVFKTIQLHKLKTDNPEIETLFTDSFSLLSPNPDMASKWVHVYYGMFDKAARRIGLPPLMISEKTTLEAIKINNFKSITAIANHTAEDFIDTATKDFETRKQRDAQLSPELAKFWQSVENDLNRLDEEDENYTLEESLIDLYPVMYVQALLQRQQDEFSFIRSFEVDLK